MIREPGECCRVTAYSEHASKLGDLKKSSGIAAPSYTTEAPERISSLESELVGLQSNPRSSVTVGDRALIATLKASHGDNAYLSEPSREGWFIFDSSDLSDEVSADSFQGIYLAPEWEPTGVSGAWVRVRLGNVHAGWFGAVGSGSDESRELQAALEFAQGSTLELDGLKSYVVGSTVVFAGTGPTTIQGNGATIKGAATRVAGGYFDVSGSSLIIFDSIRFDMMQPSLPAYTNIDYGTLHNTAIRATSGWDNITIKNCEFTNLYTNAVYLYQGINVTITDNVFRSPVQAQTTGGLPGAQDLSHIFMLTCGGRKVIQRNKFLNDPIHSSENGVNSVYMSGMTGETIVDSNYSNYAGRNNAGSHRLGDYDVYGDGQNIQITNNVADHVMAQFMRLSSINGLKFENNKITLDQNSSFDESTISVEGVTFFGGEKGSKNHTIAGNSFSDPNQRHAVAIAIIGYDYDYPANNMKVYGNTFRSYRKDFLLSGPFENVQYRNNMSVNGKGINVDVVVGTGLTGVEANGKYEELYITGNRSRNTAINGSGIVINLGAATTAKVGYIAILDNHIYSTVAAAGQGIVGLANSSNRANNTLKVEGNVVDNYAYNYFMREAGQLIFERNISRRPGLAAFLNGGGQLELSLENNIWVEADPK